ncbi:MAG: hypothetical protein NVS2B16_18970 [Chloroflexota bacterium]
MVVHTVHMSSFGPGYPKAASEIFRRAEIVCARSTDFFVAVGEDIALEYSRGGIAREDQVTIIRSPIDIPAFIAARGRNREEQEASRRRFAVPENVPIILGCGLLEKRKRWDLLLRAIAPLLQAREACFVLAGTGQEQTAIRHLSRDLGVSGQVIMPGYVTDVPALFAIASVLVHTSLVEGVPQVVVQALAAGVPVVATDVEGIRELAPLGIAVLPASGQGLTATCRGVLARGAQPPIDPRALDSWTASAIEVRLKAFHSRLRAAVESRS